MSPSTPFTFTFPIPSNTSFGTTLTAGVALSIPTITATHGDDTRAMGSPIVHFPTPAITSTAIDTSSAAFSTFTSATTSSAHSPAIRSSVSDYRASGGLDRAMAERQALLLYKRMKKRELELENQAMREQEKQKSELSAEANEVKKREKEARESPTAAARLILAPTHNAMVQPRGPASGRNMNASSRRKLFKSTTCERSTLHTEETKPFLFRTIPTQRGVNLNDVDHFSEVQLPDYIPLGRHIPFLVDMPLEFFMKSMHVAQKDGDVLGYTNDNLVGDSSFWNH